jgi:D-sedoheptulose 7-phosphate isomerase
MTAFDPARYLETCFTEHDEVFHNTQRAVKEGLLRLIDIAAAAVRGGGKLIFFGNGGSAGDAQHLATELTVRFAQDREPIAAIALTTDSSALTAIGNDMGFEQIFARQIKALGRQGDLAIGISTSGRSRNVILGLEAARDMGLTAAGFGGGDGGAMTGLADPLLLVPATSTARIQEMHIMLGQMLCGALERTLGLV